MKKSLACTLIFLQLFEAYAELIFMQLAESQSLDLASPPHPRPGVGPTGLYLYQRGARSQTTLLSVSRGGAFRVDPEMKARLRLSGGLDSARVNVSLTQLRPGDTGLYMWEMSYRDEDGSDRMVLGDQKVFLLVEAKDRQCQCSTRYHPLIWTIFTAAGLLLLALSWLAIDKCVKVRTHQRLQPSAPIYEEMSRKQRSPQRHHREAPSHLEEARFPVYANPNIRQPQDNYYACPRQIAMQGRRSCEE